MKIPVFLPSFNRASQLHLLLESVQSNCPNLFYFYIVYRSSDKNFENGYEKLKNEYSLIKDVCWIQEINLKGQFYEFLRSFSDTIVCLLTDDCVFYRKFECLKNETDNLLAENVWSLSFRLGKNTNVSNYETNKIEKDINLVFKNDKFVYYNFLEHEYLTNYGFWFSWDGQLYRASDLLEIFNGSDFEIDNRYAILLQRIEHYMMNRRSLAKRNLMVIPNDSCVVSMNWNSTHMFANYKRARLEELNRLYLEDMVIDINSIDFSDVASCHHDKPFLMKKIK